MYIMPKPVYSCETLYLLHILGKKWTIPIVEMLYPPRRNVQFNKMQMALDNITSKNLSSSLKELCDAKIVKKTEIKRGNAVNTIYSLTERGVALEGFIKSAKMLGVSLYNINASCTNRRCGECALRTV
jgi:DNA-binding HxlR family transcriptional regulator